MKKTLLTFGVLMAVVCCTLAFAANSESRKIAVATEESTTETETQEEENWVEINLETAGSLGVEILYQVDKLQDVTHLRVSGPMNSADWTTLKQCGNIQHLDLTDAGTTSIPGSAFYNRSSLQSILLPKNLTSIGYSAFRGTSLTEIVFPESVTSMGDECFYECKSLEKAVIKGVKAISEKAFYNCENLTSVSLPEGLTNINNYAFYNCINLPSIDLPNSLASIGDDAFGMPREYKNGVYYVKSKLTDIVLPENLQSIGREAFYSCAFTKVVLPTKLTSLGYHAFYDCNYITEVVLPMAISNYQDSRAFEHCSLLKTVTCPAATPPTWDYNPFYGLSFSGMTLKVPDFAVVNYKLDSKWYNFGTIEGGVTSDYWAIKGDLSLANNRRMDGTPSVEIFTSARLSVGGNTPMTVDNLIIHQNLNTSAYAQLINSCPDMTANSSTMDIFTAAKKWYFITMPCDVNVADVTHSAGSDFVFRYYDGANRAQNGTGSNWKNLPEDGVLEAGKGYICQCFAEGTLSLPIPKESIKTLLSNKNRAITAVAHVSENAANAGWNYIGNPYLSHYDMAATSLTCPITLWDGSKYVAYSLIDDNVVLKPMQAFFIQQADVDADVTFTTEGRQFTTEISRAQTPRRKAAASDRTLINLTICGSSETSQDRTRVVINPDASMAYETACDASKFFADEDGEEIYTIDAGGNRLAINERPLEEGEVRLGIRTAGKEALSISADSKDMEIELIDRLEGKTMVISGGASYTFTSESAGFCDDRFSIRIRRVASAVEGLGAEGKAALDVQTDEAGMIVSGAKGKSILVCRIDGAVVAEIKEASDAETINVAAGVYVVKVGKETVKCIVR